MQITFAFKALGSSAPGGPLYVIGSTMWAGLTVSIWLLLWLVKRWREVMVQIPVLAVSLASIGGASFAMLWKVKVLDSYLWSTYVDVLWMPTYILIVAFLLFLPEGLWKRLGRYYRGPGLPCCPGGDTV